MLFVEPPANTWGTIARNSMFGPGFADVDLSVFKNTRFNIHDFPINAQFRAEMYNLFNRVNLASPACTQLCNDYFERRRASAQPARRSVRVTSPRASDRASRSTCSWL